MRENDGSGKSVGGKNCLKTQTRRTTVHLWKMELWCSKSLSRETLSLQGGVCHFFYVYFSLPFPTLKILFPSHVLLLAITCFPPSSLSHLKSLFPTLYSLPLIRTCTFRVPRMEFPSDLHLFQRENNESISIPSSLLQNVPNSHSF
uniref:Uncharacterized protein n=1 Tax=Cacopsylla melanoneura TaxID=428564 RepID=A0A8D8ZG24_9HEMI